MEEEERSAVDLGWSYCYCYSDRAFSQFGVVLRSKRRPVGGEEAAQKGGVSVRNWAERGGAGRGGCWSDAVELNEDLVSYSESLPVAGVSLESPGADQERRRRKKKKAQKEGRGG